MAITHETLRLEAGELPVTVARRGGTGAAVVIVPSAFGVGPDLEEQMEELATDARMVVSFDPFFRTDPGLVAYDDMARVMGRLQSLDRERSVGDVGAVLAFAGRPAVIVGICFGGPFALLAAADALVDGVVTWHGSRMDGFVARAAEMRCPMRLHFGAVDPVVPPSMVEGVRAAFAGRPDVRIEVHEGATHGFSHRASARSYDASAERAGMSSVLELVRSAFLTRV